MICNECNLPNANYNMFDGCWCSSYPLTGYVPPDLANWSLIKYYYYGAHLFDLMPGQDWFYNFVCTYAVNNTFFINFYMNSNYSIIFTPSKVVINSSPPEWWTWVHRKDFFLECFRDVAEEWGWV